MNFKQSDPQMFYDFFYFKPSVLTFEGGCLENVNHFALLYA